MYDDRQGPRSPATDKEITDSWDAKLIWFRDNIYPTLAPYGFSLPEAFLAFKMNQVQNEISGLAIEVDEEEDEEPWKK